jgi:large subunit ribosomal protein L9
MEIILLERIAKLGQMGDTVRVRDGYARNFLLPAGKALRATDANKARFETDKAHLEARNLEARKEAEGVADKLDGQTFIVIRSAGETGQLYGSAAARDIVEVVEAGGFSIARQQVRLDRPVKTIGLHDVQIDLHPEVSVSIMLNVARSDDEADRQARGEDLTRRDAFDEPQEEEAAEAAPDLAEVFENPEDAEHAAEVAETGDAEAGADATSDTDAGADAPGDDNETEASEAGTEDKTTA